MRLSSLAILMMLLLLLISYSVSVSKDGYETGYATLTNRVGAGWVILDILSGLVPIVVDAVTGAWGGLSPDTVHLVLTPISE